MSRYFVTGGAGFIGSNLCDRLLAQGHAVTAYDNLSTGQTGFIKEALAKPNFKLVEGDLLDETKLGDSMKGHDFVFHLAANADVRFGTNHPRRDLEQNTIATYNVLEAMRQSDIKRIGFSFTGYIFRFVSILGERYSHGHVYDFYQKLSKDPTKITVLGNGKQRKSYLYVQDCVDAILTVVEKSPSGPGANIYNLGTDEYTEVNGSLDWICAKMGVNPQRSYTGGERGWIGDSPFIFLDTKKVRSLGWKPKLTIKQGVEKTVGYLAANPWLFELRG
jgi:UDP-glucose 4-epimerase